MKAKKKSMSFGKMMALFGGFVVVIMIIAVVTMKMMGSSQNNKPVVTKTYNGAARVPLGGMPPPQNKQAAIPAPTQGPSAPAPDQQAALRSQGLDAQSNATKLVVPPANQTASIASEQPAKDAQPAASAQQSSKPDDMNQRLAAMELKLSLLANRLNAYEAKPTRQTSATKSGLGKTGHQARSTRIATSNQGTPAQVLDTPVTKQSRDLPGYKSMAIVGDRAWVQLPDGGEESVATGDMVPTPRARIRNVDAASGVVITSSQERIEH